jgi:hypothetical protein
MIRWKKQPLRFEDVGVARLTYCTLLSVAAVSGIAYYILLFLASGAKTPFPLGQMLRGPSAGLSEQVTLFVWGIVIAIAISGSAAVAAILFDRPNSTWTDIRRFGECKLGRTDLVLSIIAILFLTVKLLTGEIQWFHAFVFCLVAGALLINRWSRSDLAEAEGGDEGERDPRDEELTTDDGNAIEGEVIKRNFSWSSILGGPFHIQDFPISKKVYDEYRLKNEKHYRNEEVLGQNPKDYFLFRIVGGISPDIARLVKKIAHAHVGRPPIECVEDFLQFVHQFPYSFDLDSRGFEEYARFPIEMLVDMTGDCECYSILLCSLLHVAGHGCCLVLVEVEAGAHAMVGIEVPDGVPGEYISDGQGKKYFFCEATEGRWRVGQVPWRSLKITGVYPVD